MKNNSQGRDVHKDNIRKSEPEEQGEGMSSDYITSERLVPDSIYTELVAMVA